MLVSDLDLIVGVVEMLFICLSPRLLFLLEVAVGCIGADEGGTAGGAEEGGSVACCSCV